jgi:hypothetical protein
MKNNAQAILQFTAYPLEPIVALQINKTLQSYVQSAFGSAVAISTPGQMPSGLTINPGPGN